MAVAEGAEMDERAQDEVFAFLARPETHGGAEVRRFDTHISAVFLAGGRALKVKRAVRFPFLDYSSRDQRKAACAAELEVNRRFAGDLYRRIVPVTREADGRLALGGSGQPVEWAVEMGRFDEDRTLDRLADAGNIDLALADALARAVAAAHQQAPAADAERWIAALGKYIEDNDAAFARRPDLFAPGDRDTLASASRTALARLDPLLRRRGALGLIRQGHGDLHLGNIALIDGRPVPFDAIEFDPLIASGDVLYDLAFLLMDLAERGLREAANVVLNRYLAETRRPEDLDGLAALPLFMALRAAIRAMVTAERPAHGQPAKKVQLETTARTYFRFACDVITPPPPWLVAIGGLSGTGKSVLARALAPFIAPLPGAVVVRSDVERKALMGVGEQEPLGPEGYRPDVTRAVYDAIAARARRVIAAGHSAVVDAVFALADERRALRELADTAPFAGVFLAADLETRVSRVGRRTGDASDADAAVARIQEGYDTGPVDWMVLDASGTPAETLARARSLLGI